MDDTINPTCHLLALPAELRAIIFELALVQDELIIIHYPDRNVDFDECPAWIRPGLLQSCRQIREEASVLYFSENRFLIEITDWDYGDFFLDAMRWLKSLGKTNAEALQYLEVSSFPHSIDEAKGMLLNFDANIYNELGFECKPEAPKIEVELWSDESEDGEDDSITQPHVISLFTVDSNGMARAIWRNMSQSAIESRPYGDWRNPKSRTR